MHDFKNKCKVLNVKLVYAIWVIFGFMELYTRSSFMGLFYTGLCTASRTPRH